MLFDNSRDPGANITWVGLPAHSYGSVALASPQEALKTAIGNDASPFAPSGHVAAAPGRWLLDAPLQYVTVNSTGGPGPVYFEPGLLDAPGPATSLAMAPSPYNRGGGWPARRAPTLEPRACPPLITLHSALIISAGWRGRSAPAEAPERVGVSPRPHPDYPVYPV